MVSAGPGSELRTQPRDLVLQRDHLTAERLDLPERILDVLAMDGGGDVSGIEPGAHGFTHPCRDKGAHHEK